MRREQNNQVSVSGNRCLVPQSVIPVDASALIWFSFLNEVSIEE